VLVALIRGIGDLNQEERVPPEVGVPTIPRRI
jgi:hypothetical protein